MRWTTLIKIPLHILKTLDQAVMLTSSCHKYWKWFSICLKNNSLEEYLKDFCMPRGSNFLVCDTSLCSCNGERFVFLVQRDTTFFWIEYGPNITNILIISRTFDWLCDIEYLWTFIFMRQNVKVVFALRLNDLYAQLRRIWQIYQDDAIWQ